MLILPSTNGADAAILRHSAALEGCRALDYIGSYMSEDLKKTPLNAAHRVAGGKMVDFGGWDKAYKDIAEDVWKKKIQSGN